MQIVETYTATVYVGLCEGYDGIQHAAEDAILLCQNYVDEVGLCITVTPTTYVYKKGREEGIAIGLINYPHLPSTRLEIKEHAFALAEMLKKAFKQNRVSIVTPEHTYMIGAND